VRGTVRAGVDEWRRRRALQRGVRFVAAKVGSQMGRDNRTEDYKPATLSNNFINIPSVSFPVFVFWFDGWYDPTSTRPSGV
jgi:hypothetical protein